MNSDIFIVPYSQHCGNVWSDGVYMNSDMFIVPYSQDLALHCTQDISFTLFSYFLECSCDINSKNEIKGTEKLAFVSYASSLVQLFEVPENKYLVASLPGKFLTNF